MKQTADDLTSEEKFLLRWLAKENFSAYGECHGYALNVLLNTGLAQVDHSPPSDYARVSVTEAGFTLLAAIAAEDPQP